MSTSLLADTPAISHHASHTAPVHEYRVMWTTQKHQKRKVWNDGILRLHAFNNRLLLYDENRSLVADKYQKHKDGVGEGDELDFEGHLVTVEEFVKTVVQDLGPVFAPRNAKELLPETGASTRMNTRARTPMRPIRLAGGNAGRTGGSNASTMQRGRASLSLNKSATWGNREAIAGRGEQQKVVIERGPVKESATEPPPRMQSLGEGRQTAPAPAAISWGNHSEGRRALQQPRQLDTPSRLARAPPPINIPPLNIPRATAPRRRPLSPGLPMALPRQPPKFPMDLSRALPTHVPKFPMALPSQSPKRPMTSVPETRLSPDLPIALPSQLPKLPAALPSGPPNIPRAGTLRTVPPPPNIQKGLPSQPTNIPKELPHSRPNSPKNMQQAKTSKPAPSKTQKALFEQRPLRSRRIPSSSDAIVIPSTPLQPISRWREGSEEDELVVPATQHNTNENFRKLDASKFRVPKRKQPEAEKPPQGRRKRQTVDVRDSPELKVPNSQSPSPPSSPPLAKLCEFIPASRVPNTPEQAGDPSDEDDNEPVGYFRLSSSKNKRRPKMISGPR